LLGELRIWCEKENFHTAEVRIINAGVIAINTDDDYVRPDLPSAHDREDVEEDQDYRRSDRYDVRRGEFSRDEEHLRMGPAGKGGAGGPPPEIGWIFIVGGGVFSLVVWSMAACTLFAAYNLSKKQRYLFCFVIACISCASVPLGTILGVFTIVVLARPGVKELFDNLPAETPTAEAP
jgi:hypothetical protein